ncbi:MAG: chemotaxis protein CheB, partial [Proteobacteria bacterium]
LIEPGRVRLGDGPPENGHRPAIDVLFRSAAQAYRSRVVGVILSGTLDDGTAGLWAVKRRNGLAVVQQLAEAQHPGMIRSALENVQVDHELPVAAIGELLARVSTEEITHEGVEMDDATERRLQHEVALATHATNGVNLEDPYGHDTHPAGFACPSCGGTLWELHDGPLVRYRCRVGHAYNGNSLMAEQNERLEEALWSACRALEENAALAGRLARRAAASRHTIAQGRFEARARSATERAALLRQLLQTTPDLPEPERDGDLPEHDGDLPDLDAASAGPEGK